VSAETTATPGSLREAMPNKQFNPYRRLEDALESWRRDYVHGRLQVLMRRGRSRSPFAESTSLRLQAFSAAEDLERWLGHHFRRSLEHLAAEVCRSHMPPSEACPEYVARAARVSKDYTDRFKEMFAEFNASRADWDENERPLSQDEIQGYANKFESEVVAVRDDSISDFKVKTWDAQASTEREPRDTTHERATHRRAFVQPWLDNRGWSLGDWATQAEVDKNSVRDYMNGKTIKIRSSTLRKIANALGIKATEMPK
jgi:hypothetical protein